MDGSTTVDQLERTVDKLGGNEGMERFLDGDLVVRLAAAPNFPIFKLGNKGAFFDYVLAQVKELGLVGGTTFKEVCNRGIKCGLQLCGNNVNFDEEYRNLPDDRVVRVAMKTFSQNGETCIRAGSRNDGAFTNILPVSPTGFGPGRIFGADDQFVFAVPRKK